GAPFPRAPRGTHRARWSEDRSARRVGLLRYRLRHGGDEGRVTRSRAACPFLGWRNREALGEKKPLGGIDCSFIIREWGKLGCGSRIFYLMWGGGAGAGEKQEFLWINGWEPGGHRGGARPPGLSGCDLGTRPTALPALRLVPLTPGRGQARLAYFAALAPAAAAKPSCWPVPPL